MMLDLSTLDFEKGGGLVTVVAQDASTGSVLMVAHADREALEHALATGEMHYRSRTRGLWHKGATSGSTQRVVSLTADCDGDAVLARIAPAGPACHTGAVSCFGERAMGGNAIEALDATIAARAGETAVQAAAGAAQARAGAAQATAGAGQARGDTAVPAAAGAARATGDNAAQVMPGGAAVRPSYTRRLLNDRNLRLKKLGEEAAELVTACADGDAARAAEEAADLVYHVLVALRAVGAGLPEVQRVLSARAAG